MRILLMFSVVLVSALAARGASLSANASVNPADPSGCIDSGTVAAACTAQGVNGDSGSFGGAQASSSFRRLTASAYAQVLPGDPPTTGIVFVSGSAEVKDRLRLIGYSGPAFLSITATLSGSGTPSYGEGDAEAYLSLFFTAFPGASDCEDQSFGDSFTCTITAPIDGSGLDFDMGLTADAEADWGGFSTADFTAQIDSIQAFDQNMQLIPNADIVADSASPEPGNLACVGLALGGWGLLSIVRRRMHASL